MDTRVIGVPRRGGRMPPRPGPVTHALSHHARCPVPPAPDDGASGTHGMDDTGSCGAEGGGGSGGGAVP